MAHIDIEQMAPFFTKYHLRGPWDDKIQPVIHHFTGNDEGDPHDHPWTFRSTILQGYYVERVYTRGIQGYNEVIHSEGDSFLIVASHIHQIIEVSPRGCYSLIIPYPELATRKSGFWQFREDGDYHRKWDQQEWSLIIDVNEEV